MDKLEAKSALYTHYHPGEYGAFSNQPLSFCERRGLSIHHLAVWDSQAVNGHLASTHNISLPGPGQSACNDAAAILWSAPGRFLIVSGKSAISEALSGIADGQGALQEMSSSRTIVRLRGGACRRLMAKGLTVDLSADSFKTGDVMLSSFNHHYPAMIHNVSLDTDVFDIFITRSLALSFWHWLCDSALELGYQVLEPQRNG